MSSLAKVFITHALLPLTLLDKSSRNHHNPRFYMQPFLLPNISAHRPAGAATPMRR